MFGSRTGQNFPNGTGQSFRNPHRDFSTGVEAVAGGRHDMLLVTLEERAQRKEHLRYRDFPLSERRFHGPSKAGTTRASKQGHRHLAPADEGERPITIDWELEHAMPFDLLRVGRIAS